MKKLSRFKRKIIQIAAFGFSNPYINNLPLARIYKGKWKYFCNPGLNCYSCPAASLFCPVGALQAVNGSMDFHFSFYVVGFLLAAGIVLGRWICGFLCPFGFIQELIGKMPFRKYRLPRWTRFLKYIILLVFVFVLPWMDKALNFMGIGDPAFCKYICPAGLLLGGVPLLLGDSNLSKAIGPIFSVKLFILILVILGCMFVYRFFCKIMCPLGALYGLLNKISFYRLHIDRNLCTRCGACKEACRMDIFPAIEPDSVECIRCGECISACRSHAISLVFLSKSGEKTS